MMAVPASFNESNLVIGSPPIDKDENVIAEGDNCECLSVLVTRTPEGTPVVVSCWKLTKEELEEVNRTGRVWLEVVGVTMPPVSVQGCKPYIKEFYDDTDE